MRRSRFLTPVVAAIVVMAAAGPVAAQTQTAPGWALDRIDQAALPLDGTYTTGSEGAGVNAYVIDTGINTGLADFGGRASVAYDVFGGNGQDCASSGSYHGTGMASMVGGATYGVAKQVNLLSVKAEQCGVGPVEANYITAINWVAAHHQKPAVAVISSNWPGATYWNGNALSGLTKAVDDLAAAGVFVAVSAGNITAGDPLAWTKTYAVNNPPANASQALVVMASDPADRAVLNLTVPGTTTAWSTAIGGDIYAPGFGVMMLNGDGTFGAHHGTSFAAPMAAGVGALYKAAHGDAPSATVRSWILSHATAGAVVNNPGGTPGTLTYTPNLLLSTGGL
ncbi:S8 family serine peptidase [Actinocorallia longicatena]